MLGRIWIQHRYIFGQIILKFLIIMPSNQFFFEIPAGLWIYVFSWGDNNSHVKV